MTVQAPGPTLDGFPAGKPACVVAVRGEDDVALRLLEMGLLPGVEVTVIRRAPLGDPIEVDVMGYRLVLRRSEALQISVREPGA